MALAIGCLLAISALAIGGVCAFTQHPARTAPRLPPPPRTPPRKTPPPPPPRKVSPPDPVASLTAEWLADERPAWETVEAFERSVEAALQGRKPARGDRVSGESPFRVPSMDRIPF